MWRRTLLQTPEQRDVDSRVYWLQTAVWHADLRLPAGRPEFDRVHSLRQCTRAHLEWLLRQEGFAGVTTVDGNICEWHRRMDYHPRDWRDIGNMHFCAAGLEESGVEQQYRERWEPEPLACRRFSAQRLQCGGWQHLLLRAGEFFMHLRPRSLDEADARRLWARVEEKRANLDEMRQLADFEISFGRHQEGVLHIVHSTLPWLEGGILPQMGDWTTLPGDR